MSHDKLRGRGLFGLAILAACALMATTAGAAQAAEYTIGSKTLTELGIKEESVKGTGGAFSFSFTPSGVPIKIDCTSALIDGGSIGPKGIFGGAIFGGEILFSGCELFFNKLPKVCAVSNVRTVKVKGVLTTHFKEVYNVLSPDAGTTFMLFTASDGTESCPIKGEKNISGTIAALTEAGERVEQPWTFSPTITTLLATQLFYGASPVSVNGKLAVALSGANKALKWAAIE